MSRLKKLGVIISSTLALGLCGATLWLALRSPLFVVQVVEVVEPNGSGLVPLDAYKIAELAAVPVGKANLFFLNLKEVQSRILANSWIHNVHLEKQFPQTLVVSVTFRKPRALIQQTNGGIVYLDERGVPFEKVDLRLKSDLPLLSGFEGRMSLAIEFLNKWDSFFGASKSPSNSTIPLELSSLEWEKDGGFRVWVSYPLDTLISGNSGAKKKARASVDLGAEVGSDLDLQLARLQGVTCYLVRHNVAVRHIWADAGKKIVVKTAFGS
ncbi:FtsQ-type POTRA domain-containing protein [Bdellovibrionota bacterium FG-2]